MMELLNSDFVSIFFNQPTYDVVIQLMAMGGWAILDILLIFATVELLLFYKQHLKYMKEWEFVLLAIDIPAINVQTPKAVEQLFSHLAGSLNSPNISEKFREGFKQRPFSFEIISIEGYIQFLIRTEVYFRDLLEAAIYAQYPDADIVEVEDYVNSVPTIYPDDEYDTFNVDFCLEQDDAYPLRTYQEFEHTIAEDTVLKDPMGTFLESFSRIGPGEQVWFQIVVRPTTNAWKEKAIKVVKDLIGEKQDPSGGSKIADAVGNASLKFVEEVGDQIFGREGSVADGKDMKRSEPKSQMLYLSPGQKKLVEDIELKISKIGFQVKMRGVYVARKEVFAIERALYALLGAVYQYNVPTANSIDVARKVTSYYFFANTLKAWKQRRMMSAYKNRSFRMGYPPFILNIEELATIWHFPMSHVKTPLVQKASDKKSEPPPGLPVESFESVLGAELPTSDLPSPSDPDYKIDAGPDYGADQKFG